MHAAVQPGLLWIGEVDGFEGRKLRSVTRGGDDFVGATEVHGRNDRRMRTAPERRGAGDDALHAGDARGDD